MRHNIYISGNVRQGGIKMLLLALVLVIAVFTVVPCFTSALYAQSANNAAESVKNGNPQGAGLPGQGFTEEDFKPRVEEESTSWMIIKTILVLGLFVAGFYFFYRFVTQKAGIHISGHEAIQILSTVPVGPNKFLQIVDVAGKVFLIGVSDNSINLLTEIKDRDEVDRIRLLSSRSTPVQGKGFQDFITAQIGRIIERINERRAGGGKGKADFEMEKDFDISYLNRQKRRLKNIDGGNEE